MKLDTNTPLPSPGVGERFDFLSVPTRHGVFAVRWNKGMRDDMPWLYEPVIEDPEVAEEYEVVTVPMKMLLRKGGPRP